MVNPTIQRRRLGLALKRARESAGRTQDEAAVVIDAAASKISRLELGQSGIKLTDLNLLLAFYGISGEEAESLRELARAGRQRGRWSTYRNAVPDWFRQYLDLEGDASEIRWYQPEVVPGILQIEPYIRAMNATAQPLPAAEDVDRQVRVRLERQAILRHDGGPELSFILSESALRRSIGATATMHSQLLHLAEVGKQPNVALQVFPFDAQTYETASFNFVILRFNDDAASDVIYVETFTDADYLDRPDAVRAYTRLWDRLRAAALGPVESRKLILRMAHDMERQGT
ncbi:Helix-turn-helix domain-containing protein [Micromonospora citrea]|uniref:Helix-turn-helix domain-containing protein n=1 Tax=Micromonospora citrea TaxID=47855 RepID=A0A1C6U9M0_9ACTN|nr:helix-turn-helix transcriptional regulator [Micromonospora citrea]SCL50716.1 Helix-turn-helix domain-containing protein [Micromonospora citrea]